MYSAKFLENLSGKVADGWFAAALTPAFAFWAGGLIAGIQKFGWKPVVDIFTSLSEPLQVAILVFILLILAASGFILQRFDFVVVRLLEGYWPSWLAPLQRVFLKSQLINKRNAERRWQDMMKQYMQQPNRCSDVDETILVELEARLKCFPANNNKLMPTRLGNRLRAAELRPYEKYGLDAVLCWTRLWMVLPDQVRKDVADARNELNMAARIWLWSILFCVWSIWAWWALPLGFLSAFLSYNWAVSVSNTYGELIESSFDLFRFELYKTLKFPPLTDFKEEKKMASLVNTFLHRGFLP